jgi:diamine N-acetyltransferase
MVNESRPADEGERIGEPVVNIVGDRVALGPLRRELLATYHRWFNNFRTLRTTGAIPMPLTMEQQVAQFDELATSERHPDYVSFTIYRRSDLTPIGSCQLQDITFRNRTAEFVIFIAEPSERGKGYGTEATKLMLDYAFTALGLNNVMLKVYEFNLAGQRAYQKAGFREFGRRRQAQFMGGTLWDVIYMECLASEFESPVLKHVFAPDQPHRA